MGRRGSVLNVTRNFYMKRKALDAALEGCAVTWVTEGLTVRDLAPAEALRARNLQARSRKEAIVPEIVPIRASKDLEPFHESWVDRLGRCADKRKADSCEICGLPCKTVYDHCHKTEIFRGWICGKCNSMLGFALDNPETLRKAADYLENFAEKLKGATENHGIPLSHSQSEQRIQAET